MYSTSAETNVLNVAASLGMSVKCLTAFVKDSPIASFIKGQLRARNIEFEGPEITQEGPWGVRHQFNVADSGYGSRGARVYNDRAGEVGRLLCEEFYDLEKLFGEEGVEILHLSGLIAAMSPSTAKLCVAMARTAAKYGTKVSFDLNYRASFWKDREDELRAAFHEIASLADILIGNEEDFQLALGIEGPEAGGTGLQGKISGFQGLMDRVAEAYPHASVYATTLREVVDANTNLWGAILRAPDGWHIVEPRPISVLDRIGGGDGFVGGLLYGILKDWEPEKWVQFGWATGALAVTLLTDYAAPVDENQVWAIYAGNARVVR